MLTEVAAPKSDGVAAPPHSLAHVSTQLSALLADLMRVEEVELPPAPTPLPRPGDAVGRFRLTRELGRGGFGVVYEALDGDLSRTVALKLVRPGTRLAARGTKWLLREAEAVARLNHPNIVTLHDFGQGQSGPYLVFELLRGQSLCERLRAGPLAAGEAIEVALKVAAALVHAHACGVVHRDLTAANVHLGEDGAVKVLDFGLAHLFGRGGADGGGTPAYMAPEQWEGDLGGPRTDLFALGVILFHALSGRYPYRVEKGWSEALEPGETPRLPRSAGPRRLRMLVRSLLEREAKRRPQSARAVEQKLLELRRAREGARWKRVLWGLFAVALAAVALSAWLYARHEPPSGDEVKVVMAAMEDAAGVPTLEAVPGLLAAALEPSRRVRPVAPARLASAARQAGMGEPGRIDAAAGRTLARLTGAAVVLVPSARLSGGAPLLEVRAIESEGGKLVFTARASLSGRGGLPAAVDQLSDRIRRELNERVADRELRRPVAEAVTASPEAARAYYQGVDCLARRSSADGTARQCVPEFERALSFDPTFPLAHYQLAVAGFLPGDSGELARPHLEAALSAAGRLPAREALLLKALSLRVGGDQAAALRIYDSLAALAPEDAEVLSLAADTQIELGDWAAAARDLVRLVGVVPDQEQPLLELIEALGRLDRSGELLALAERLESAEPRRWRALVEARLWLGQPELALQAAREGVRERGDAELGTLSYALQAAGKYSEMEEVARRQAALAASAHSGSGRVEYALAGEGRILEALRWVEAQAPHRPQAAAPIDAYRQAMIAAATRSPRLIWPYVARAIALDPAIAADLSVVLVLEGDLAHSEAMAREVRKGSFTEEEYLALRAWKAGDAALAEARLSLLEKKDPWPTEGIAPAYLLAEVCADVGDDACTLLAVERFRRLPADRIWRAWAYPRAVLLAAQAKARTGEVEAARRGLLEWQQMVASADASIKASREAQELRRRLAPAVSLQGSR